MEIALKTSANLTFSREVIERVEAVERDYVVDSLSRKVATVKLKGYPRLLVLWKGDAYLKAGQYTDVDIDSRIASFTAQELQAAKLL